MNRVTSIFGVDSKFDWRFTKCSFSKQVLNLNRVEIFMSIHYKSTEAIAAIFYQYARYVFAILCALWNFYWVVDLICVTNISIIWEIAIILQSVLGKGDPSKHTGSNFDHSAEEGGKVSNDEYDASKSTQEPLYKTSSRASTRVSGNKPPSQGRASSYGSASKESRSKAGGKARTLTTTKSQL